MQDHVRFYEIAGITVSVQSDLPITNATFHPKFERFRTDGPAADTVIIRHHFGLPDPVPGMGPAKRPAEV